MSEDSEKIRIYSSDKLWNIKKKVYSLYNIKLPVPVEVEQFGYFVGVEVLVAVLRLNFLPFVLRYVVLPYLIVQFLSKKKLDGKNPILFFIGYLEYLVLEKGTYVEKFKKNIDHNEEIIKINWYCSQGYYLEEDMRYETINKHISSKNKKIKPIKKVKIKKTTDESRSLSKSNSSVKKNVIKNANLKTHKIKEKIKVNKSISINWLPGIDGRQNEFLKEITGFLKESNKKFTTPESQKEDMDYIIYSQEVNSLSGVQADYKIMMCSLETNYLKDLARAIKEQKKIKEWCFIFINLNKEEMKKAGDLMEDYKTFYISSEQSLTDKQKIFNKILN